jgi:hypothetical protein
MFYFDTQSWVNIEARGELREALRAEEERGFPLSYLLFLECLNHQMKHVE